MEISCANIEKKELYSTLSSVQMMMAIESVLAYTLENGKCRTMKGGKHESDFGIRFPVVYS